MSGSRPFLTVRDPRDSFWQSVVERVAGRADPSLTARGTVSVTDEAARAAGGSGRYRAFVDAANAHVYDLHKADEDRAGAPLVLAGSISPEVSTVSEVAAPAEAGVPAPTSCEALALRLAKAKVFGTAEEVLALQDQFDFSSCDPFWADCVAEYVAHYHSHSGDPDRPSNPQPVLSYIVPKNAVVAIFGDWGTGEPRAVELLTEIKAFQPDILIHLGDIYYSGTREEVQDRFLNVVSRVFGDAWPRVFSLCGNHDMYAGGEGYYGLVETIGQVSSYFAVQNDDWRFVAMDTGLNDGDPFTVNSAATFLEPSDVEWVADTVAGAGDRKVVLFSHHPPFSAYEPIGGASVNEKLLGQVEPSLPRVSAWFWGHEHRLGIYDGFRGVERGRCLGHGAIPIFENTPAEAIRFPEVPVHLESGSPLSMGVAGGLFKTGFAVMTLDGKDARVRYFRSGESTPLWEEAF